MTTPWQCPYCKLVHAPDIKSCDCQTPCRGLSEMMRRAAERLTSPFDGGRTGEQEEWLGALTEWDISSPEKIARDAGMRKYELALGNMRDIPYWDVVDQMEKSKAAYKKWVELPDGHKMTRQEKNEFFKREMEAASEANEDDGGDDLDAAKCPYSSVLGTCLHATMRDGRMTRPESCILSHPILGLVWCDWAVAFVEENHRKTMGLIDEIKKDPISADDASDASDAHEHKDVHVPRRCVTYADMMEVVGENHRHATYGVIEPIDFKEYLDAMDVPLETATKEKGRNEEEVAGDDAAPKPTVDIAGELFSAGIANALLEDEDDRLCNATMKLVERLRKDEDYIRICNASKRVPPGHYSLSEDEVRDIISGKKRIKIEK